MNYDLVFEGGGAKGMVFVGAMQEFEERGHAFNRLLGTSAGAIVTVFLAAGYSANEMKNALAETVDNQPVFATFLEPPDEFDTDTIRQSNTFAALEQINIPLLPRNIEDDVEFLIAKTFMSRFLNLFSLIERGGWYSANNFLNWMRRKLDEGRYRNSPRKFSHMTLSEFYDVTKCDLSLIASDTTAGRMRVLNHVTAPNLPIVWAVRMSMSIPMVWPEVVWETKWGNYLGKDLSGHLIVDGGLLSNFPIELFFSDAKYHLELMGKQKGGRVLGLLIDETLEVENVPAKVAPANPRFDFGQLQLVQRVGRLINTATGAHDKMVLEAFEEYVVHLPALDYDTIDFDMSVARREALINAGRKTMREYLDFRDEAPFAIGGIEQYYEIDISDYANEMASKILEQ